MQTLFKKNTIHKGIIITALLFTVVIIVGLEYFLSGFLAAIMLYAVTRGFYLKLVEKRKVNKTLATWIVLLLLIISVAVPLWIILEILIPQISKIVKNPQDLIDKFQPIVDYIQNNKYISDWDFKISNEQIIKIVNGVLAYVPYTLNWIGQFLTNVVVALFILYFMLNSSRKMESIIKEILPFSPKGTAVFVAENIALIRSNAFGVPILALSQGVIAIIGYMIFGVENAVFLGLLTGLTSVVPVVGTMLVWVPICIYQIATGSVNGGLMLAVYCIAVVGSIDNVLRFTLLKKMADVHPLITVFGVVLGVNFFGILGLVFGPMIVSLPGILYKVYKIERFGIEELSTSEELQNNTSAEETSTEE